MSPHLEDTDKRREEWAEKLKRREVATVRSRAEVAACWISGRAVALARRALLVWCNTVLSTKAPAKADHVDLAAKVAEHLVVAQQSWMRAVALRAWAQIVERTGQAGRVQASAAAYTAEHFIKIHCHQWSRARVFDAWSCSALVSGRGRADEAHTAELASAEHTALSATRRLSIAMRTTYRLLDTVQSHLCSASLRAWHSECLNECQRRTASCSLQVAAAHASATGAFIARYSHNEGAALTLSVFWRWRTAILVAVARLQAEKSCRQARSQSATKAARLVERFIGNRAWSLAWSCTQVWRSFAIEARQEARLAETCAASLRAEREARSAADVAEHRAAALQTFSFDKARSAARLGARLTASLEMGSVRLVLRSWRTRVTAETCEAARDIAALVAREATRDSRLRRVRAISRLADGVGVIAAWGSWRVWQLHALLTKFRSRKDILEADLQQLQGDIAAWPHMAAQDALRQRVFHAWVVWRAAAAASRVCTKEEQHFHKAQAETAAQLGKVRNGLQEASRLLLAAEGCKRAQEILLRWKEAVDEAARARERASTSAAIVAVAAESSALEPTVPRSGWSVSSRTSSPRRTLADTNMPRPRSTTPRESPTNGFSAVSQPNAPAVSPVARAPAALVQKGSWRVQPLDRCGGGSDASPHDELPQRSPRPSSSSGGGSAWADVDWHLTKEREKHQERPRVTMLQDFVASPSPSTASASCCNSVGNSRHSADFSGSCSSRGRQGLALMVPSFVETPTLPAEPVTAAAFAPAQHSSRSEQAAAMSGLLLRPKHSAFNSPLAACSRTPPPSWPPPNGHRSGALTYRER